MQILLRNAPATQTAPGINGACPNAGTIRLLLLYPVRVSFGVYLGLRGPAAK
jgi:hypothetical protein